MVWFCVCVFFWGGSCFFALEGIKPIRVKLQVSTKFCRLWFQCQFSFQSSCSVIWTCLVYAPLSDHSETRCSGLCFETQRCAQEFTYHFTGSLFLTSFWPYGALHHSPLARKQGISFSCSDTTLIVCTWCEGEKKSFSLPI